MSDDEITSLKEGPEQTGLSLFCQIEKALQMESFSEGSDDEIQTSEINKSKSLPSDAKPSYLAEDFPELFKFNSPLQQIDINVVNSSSNDSKNEKYEHKIKQKLKFIKIQQDELEQQKIWIQQQLKIIEESKQIQTDYKEKYEKLQKKYNEEKSKWTQEKMVLVAKISELENVQKNNYLNSTISLNHSRGNLIDLTNTTNKLNNSILLANSSKINKNKKNRKNSTPRRKSPKSSTKRSRSKSPHNSPPHNESSHNSPKNKSPQRSSPSPTKYSDNTIPFSKIQKERVRDKIEKANNEKSDSHIPKAYYKSMKKHMFGIPVEEKYLNFQFKLPQPIGEEEKKDGRKILFFKDGSKATQFRNKTIKATHGQSVFYFFANGDIGQEFHDGFRSYLYNETGTIEVTKTNHPKILVFKNGQREKHTADGKKYVLYPNGQFEEIEVNGDFKMYYPDGKIEQKVNGEIVDVTE